MPAPALTPKEMIAFKVGARARKFMLEDCVIEGYEVLLTSLSETKETDPELHALLQTEMAKYEKRVARYENDEIDAENEAQI